MKLNRQATLELTASLWLHMWLYGRNKATALRDLGFLAGMSDFWQNCPCCQYVFENSPTPPPRFCGTACPLISLWAEKPNKYYCPCEDSPTSPFSRYIVEDGGIEAAFDIAEYAGKLAGTWPQLEESE